MGEVFVARHRRMRRVVALKVIRREQLADGNAVERFRREAQVVAQLSHPNIVAVYDAGEEADAHYLAMELIDGIDLGKMLRSYGYLPVPMACDYIRQAALGLHHAHQRGFVHRDIKPHNLLVAPRGGMGPGGTLPPLERFFGGTVKILDLGLVRLLAPPAPHPDDPLTNLGIVIGTVDYVAPEQARNARGVDHRADIYSLGCTLYHLLAGHPPFPGGEHLDRLLRHQSETPRPTTALRPDVPGELEQVLQRMMAKRPEDRFDSAAIVAEVLTPLAGALVEPTAVILNPSLRPPLSDNDFLAPTRPLAPPLEESTPKDGPGGGVPSRRRRRRWLAGLAGLVGLVLLGLGAICWPRAPAIPPSLPQTATSFAADGYEPHDCAGGVEIDVRALGGPPGGQKRLHGLVGVLRDSLPPLPEVLFAAEVEHLRLVWKQGDACNPVVLARCRLDGADQPAPSALTSPYPARLPPYLIFSTRRDYVVEAQQQIRLMEGRSRSAPQRRFVPRLTGRPPLLWLNVCLDRLGQLPPMDSRLRKVLQLSREVEGSATCTEKEMSGVLHFTTSSTKQAGELSRALKALRDFLDDSEFLEPLKTRPALPLVHLARISSVIQSGKNVRVELRVPPSMRGPGGLLGGTSALPGG
jgi:serine/threonine-protein kinase